MNDLTTAQAGGFPATASNLIRANYEMTKEEAEMLDGILDRTESDYRFYLRKMRDEKGWKALGYSSFDEYGEKRRGLTGTRLYQLAQAAEIQLSLNSPKGENIPETHLRPLAPLSDEERRKVWEEATAKAAEENKKLTAKAVKDAVDRLNREKAELQERAEQFREQDNKKRQALKEKEQLLQTAQAEAARLRNAIAAEAEKLASASVLELQNKLDNLEIDKSELEDKIQKLRKEQDSAVETRTKQKLQEHQDEINRREAQLQSIMRSIEIHRQRMEQVEEADKVYVHFQDALKKIKSIVHALTDEFREACDTEVAPFLPSAFTSDFERIAIQLEQGVHGLRQYLNNVEIRQLEVIVNG